MMAFKIPPELIIHEGSHWVINHRVDTEMPGYLMIGARDNKVRNFSDLSTEALVELGPLIGQATKFVEEELKPKRLFCSRYGYAEGYSIHFHVVPIYGWLEDEFFNDPEYAKLHCDGSSLTLFLWREYIESPVKREIKGPLVTDVVKRLKGRFEQY